MIKVRVNDYRRAWLRENNIKFRVITTQLNPYSYAEVPVQVELNESDAILFKLRWGE